MSTIYKVVDEKRKLKPSVTNQETFVGGLIYEIHPDRIIFKREIYNILDLLGDVGGLREALKSFGVLIIYLSGQANGL